MDPFYILDLLGFAPFCAFQTQASQHLSSWSPLHPQSVGYQDAQVAVQWGCLQKTKGGLQQGLRVGPLKASLVKKLYFSLNNNPTQNNTNMIQQCVRMIFVCNASHLHFTPSLPSLDVRRRCYSRMLESTCHLPVRRKTCVARCKHKVSKNMFQEFGPNKIQSCHRHKLLDPNLIPPLPRTQGSNTSQGALAATIRCC